VVVGGGFANIANAGTPQPWIAMLDATTGALRTWAPNIDGYVGSIAVDGDTVYISGEFRNVGSDARDRLAAINAMGVDAAKATSWDPGADNAVYQMVFANNTLYVAGLFANVGTAGTPSARAGFAAIGTDGAVKPFNPTIVPGNSVATIAATADTVYIAGTFNTVNAMPRNGAAALTTNDAGTLTSWDPNPDDTLSSMAITSNSVVLGGQLDGLRGVERKHLLAFDANANLTNWTPEADNEVSAVAVAGTTLYVGGSFNTLGGQPRGNLGAVSTTDGALSDWNPNVDGQVYALAVANDAVYAGGAFANANVGAGTAGVRTRLAAFDPTTGAVNSWAPAADQTVRALALNGSNVYVGGDFTMLGGATRNHLGSVPTSMNTATSWDPNVTGTSVYAVVATDDVIYAGGEFTGVGAGPTVRGNFVALDTNGAATAWAPNPDAAVYTLLLTNSQLYIGGDFGAVETAVGRTRYAVYGSLDTTPALEVDPDYLRNFDLAVRSLSAGTSGKIFAGGDFTSVSGSYQSGFAALIPGQ
jgi:hypothetical protein